MNHLTLAALFLFSLFSISAFTESNPREPVKNFFDEQLSSIASTDYEAFVSHTDSNFRQSVTQAQFKDLANALSEKLQSGYASTYLGTLNQKGLKVYLWKITYTDTKDDDLVKMVLRENEEIAGFWIQ